MKRIKISTIEEVVEALKNAPPQTEEQKRQTYRILKEMGFNAPLAFYKEKKTREEEKNE